MSLFVLNILVIYLVFCCNQFLLASKTLRTPGAAKPEYLNDCVRCKVLTDSFNHWLDKTSRGKYEGGDAAWEEAKLKSYARSEIRLVEVQEGLCSELNRHQDDCYMLAEEAEQVLEKWWFHEDPNTVDLHTWLCIETLQHCCPKHHYGEYCSPCPLDKNNKICNGHGKCNGEGTRTGNGTCICKRGYIGDFCDECSKNYYAVDDVCEPCHHACDGCSGGGSSACNDCKPGWQLDLGLCTDIDECLSSSTCKSEQYCLNKEGSYTCKSCDGSCKTCLGAGPLNCTSCEPADVLWSGRCISESLKSEYINIAIKRLCLYIGLLVISIFIYRTSKPLASIVIIIIAVYIFYSEKSLKLVNTLDVIHEFLVK